MTINRNGVFVHRRNGTLSMSWRYRFHWIPSFHRSETVWCVIWLWFGVEWLRIDDTRANMLVDLLSELARRGDE